MNKGLIGKISLFSLVFLAVIMKPAFSSVNPGDLRSLYGGSICNSHQCPVWINATKGDMFFANGDNVFIVANYSCSPPSVCNSSMTVTGNFSAIGGSSSVAGVFKQNGTAASWAIFELNSTVNFSAISDSIAMSNENIFLNATDGNGNSSSYNDQLNATVMLVNMSVLLSCPPSGQGQIPSQIMLLNGTVVNTTSQCISTCSADDVAQFNKTNETGSYYDLCGPAFGGSTTNFTDVAANGNFSNFDLVIDVPGRVKINFTQNVSMDTQQRSQAIFNFAMSNMMSGGRIGVNESKWNGADNNTPNLTLSARLTLYNFSGRFGIRNGLRPSISRRATYGSGDFSPCPASICSGVTWDGQNLTFDVTGFSEYSIGTGLSMVLSNTTGQNFNSTTNISYSNTRNVNFSYIPTWNSTVSPQAVKLWGNFTGTWAANVTNSTNLTNAALNYINNTVGADGAYLWNAVINDTTGGNDTNTANWTIVVDTAGPTWFTNQSSTPANYSLTTPSQFNVTWNDTTTSASTVFITIRNSTGILINNASMSNTYGGSVYNYSIVLPAGTFNWTSYANDSLNNWNASATWTFTIGNGTVPLVLSNNTSLSGTYPYSTNITGSGCPAQITCTLYRNDTGLGSASDLEQLGVGVYNYTYNTTGNQNYSSNSTNAVLAIGKGTLSLSLSAPNVNYPNNTVATSTETNIGDSDVNYTLWRNATGLVNFSTTNGTAPSGETVSLQAGVSYTYTFNTTVGPFANWTANTTGVSATATVSKGTLNLSLSVPAITYPTNTTATVTASNSGASDVNYTLYRNTSGLVNFSTTNGTAPAGETVLLGVGSYMYVLNTSGAFANWTANATGVNVNVTVAQNTSTASYMNLTINGTESNETYIYPNASNVTGWYSTSVFGGQNITFTLYSNNTNVTSTNPVNDTSTYGVGLYIYTYNTSGNTNYSSASKRFNLTISQGITNLALSISPSTSVTNPTQTIATGSGCPAQGATDVNCTLWRNSVLVGSANATNASETVTLNTGTWVYNYSTDGGSNWTSNSTTATLTVSAASFVPSSGGGGGPAPNPTITVTLTKGNANINIPSVAAGNMASVTVAKYEGVDFRQVNISVANAVNNIKIAITKLSGEPASVTHTIEGKIYHYIEVDKTNFADSDVSKVYIKFAVNKTWLTDNGVDKTNISLYRWTDKWTELTTTYQSEDSYEAFYQAESPGFSYFLIGTKGGETVTPQTPTCTERWTCTEWSACSNNQQTRTCTDANACGTTASKPVESQDCVVQQGETLPAVDYSWMYYTVAAIIIIAIAIVLFIFFRKKK